MTEGEIIAIISLAGMVLVAVIQAITNSKTVGRRLEKIEEHSKEQYLSILRLTVMSEEMPVSERIIAGKKYIDMGGNGDIKTFYKEFVKRHTK